MKSKMNLKSINGYTLKRRSTSAVISIFRLGLMIGLAYIFLFPVIYMLTVSFQTPESAGDPSVMWIPTSLSLDNFKVTMEVLDYWKSFSLSAKISVFSTIANVVSCSLVGYGLARFKFREKGIVFAMVILTIIVPSQATMISSYLNFRFFDFGGIMNLLSPITGKDSISLLETSWVFILPSIFANGIRSGFYIFIFRQFFAGLPVELEEAAKIDGCGIFKTFIRIMVPNAVPCFVTIILFCFIWHWNEYYGSVMYFASGVRPINAMLESLVELLRNSNLYIGNTSTQQIRMYLASGSLLAVWPPLILYVFLQRYFREGIAKTGIVG